MIDSRKTLKIRGEMQILAKINTFEQSNSLQELSCKAVTQSLTLTCSITVPWFDFRSCFWGPPLSTPMKPKTRQVDIFVELFLQLKMALNVFKLLSITIDHYRSLSTKKVTITLTITICQNLTIAHPWQMTLFIKDNIKSEWK